MNSKVEVICDYIKNKCKRNRVILKEVRNQDPIDYISIHNNQGDLASISASTIILEPASYSPKWTKYIKKWATEEGFPDDKIKNQNLIRQISPDEAVDFLSR